MMNHSSRVPYYTLLPLFGVCVLLVLLGASMAHAATYYVATTGNDSNPGTLSQPFKSFSQGVSMLQPGDTLYIRGGLYTEQINLSRKSGTASAWITIAGYPGETVTIRYVDPLPASYGPIKARGPRGYLIFENLILDGINTTDESKWQIRDGNHHFILRNLEIKNFPTSALFVSADDVTIQNCRFRDNTSSGEPGKRGYGVYYSYGSNGLIEGNDIFTQVGGGIQVYPGPVSNLVIRGNKIHDNNTTVNSPIGGIIVLSTHGPISNVSIYNNLIYNNGSSPKSGPSPGIRVEGAQTTGTKIWHNTIYNNNGYGISTNQSVDTEIQNNIVFGNKRNPQIIDYGIGTILNHNLTTDPKFINPDTFDFRLQMRSPAIDEGTVLRQVTTDFREIRRPLGAAPDIGAYEDNGADLNLPRPPKNLSAR